MNDMTAPRKEPSAGAPKLRRAWTVITLALLAALLAIYSGLFLLNAVFPSAVFVVTPESCHGFLFAVGVLGRTEKGVYRDGTTRHVKSFIPCRATYYGTDYRRMGTWRSYGPGGSPAYEVEWPGATGPWEEWNEHGVKVLRASYLDGAEHGEQVIWDSDGDLVSENSYARGIPDGDWRSWSKGGTLIREVHFAGGERHGPCREWYANGQLRFYKAYDQGSPTGEWQSLDPAGNVVASIRFPPGNGLWMEMYDNGNKRVEGRFSAGMKLGRWRYWREDGQPE